MGLLAFRTRAPIRAAVLGAMFLLATIGAVTAASTGNIKIASTFWALVSSGDLAGAMSYVDPQVEFRSGTDMYSGRAQIQTVIEGYAAEGYQFHMTHFEDDGAGRIAYWYEVYDTAGTTVVSSGSDGLTIVRAGHIVFDGTAANVPEKFTSP